MNAECGWQKLVPGKLAYNSSVLAHEYNHMSEVEKSVYMEKARKYNHDNSHQGFSKDDLLLKHRKSLENSIVRDLGVLSNSAGVEFILVACNRRYDNETMNFREYTSGMLFYVWMSIYTLLKTSFGWPSLVWMSVYALICNRWCMRM